MKKLKITHKQYETILLNEQTNRLIDEQPKEVLEEGFKDVLLGVAMLMGVGLTGLNKASAQNALQNAETMAQIKSTLEDEEKIKELSDAFAEKGMNNPDSLLAKNAEEIFNNFNSLSKGDRLSSQVVTNLKSLNRELEKGYALKKSEISTDTIRGIEQKYNIVIVDTIEIELDNDNFFVSGDYNLSETGVNAWNAAIDTIKSNGGKIISANIESSTDAQSAPKFKTEYDKTGNVELARLRTKQMVWILNSLNNGIKITHREIPNNGSDVVSSKQFYDARNNKEELSALKIKTSKFRYAKVLLIVEFVNEVSETIKPEEIVKKYRFELVKVINTDKKMFIKSDKPFKKKKLKCLPKKNRFSPQKCFTF